jgi:hypothetical protein
LIAAYCNDHGFVSCEGDVAPCPGCNPDSGYEPGEYQAELAKKKGVSTILPPRPGPGEPPSFAAFKVYEYDTAMGTSAWMAWERRYLRNRLDWLERRKVQLETALRLAFDGRMNDAREEMTDGKAEACKSDV